MEKSLTIKSAGFIDGKYRIILSNDMVLDGVTHLEMEKESGDFGYIKLKIILPPTDQ